MTTTATPETQRSSKDVALILRELHDGDFFDSAPTHFGESRAGRFQITQEDLALLFNVPRLSDAVLLDLKDAAHANGLTVSDCGQTFSVVSTHWLSNTRLVPSRVVKEKLDALKREGTTVLHLK